MPTAHQPTPIPVPPEFPLAWATPEDAHRLWVREVMHFPGQITALDLSISAGWIENGMNPAFADYGFPVRARAGAFNTYFYNSIWPITFDPDELARMGQEAERRLGVALTGLWERWEREQRPAIDRIFAGWESFDLRGATNAQLANHIDRVRGEAEQVWDVHFHVVFPMVIAMSLFDDFYRETLGAEDRYETMRLLEGFENMSIRADHALYLLSRQALAAPEVKAVLERSAAAAVRAELERSDAGQAFLAELDAYLGLYGRRTTMFLLLTAPSWIEDPTPVITTLQDLITHPDHDPHHELARLAAEREQLVAAARERLAGYPEPVRGQFEFLLKAAQEAAVLQEDHNFWLDGPVGYLVREVVLELGRRLAAAGVIAESGDVFQLSIGEAQAALLDGADRRAVVAAGKAELDRFAQMHAPPVIGVLPPGPPPDDPVARAITKMFGAPPVEATAPGTLNGNGGSPGVARGRARVIRSLADAGRLGHGEILVAETTAPPWTPLFARAGGIVTDSGGILSHCAIVAREYGIPAVVGVGLGTAVIQDGQLVEVDGDAGVVRIISE